MKEIAFANAAVALAAGVFAQILAARFGVPSIVLLLLFGGLLGPDVLAWLDPDAFGAGRGDLVTLVVVVILFEGALALDVRRLREQQRSMVRLLTLGAAISMVVSAAAAWLLLEVSAPVAILYGSLMIVTGPTVVKPMLARIKLSRRVRELLVGEGVLIDPIGAIIALVAAEWVIGQHGLFVSGGLVIYRLLLGGAVGVVAGLLLAWVLRRQEWIPHDLVNPMVLGVALLVATLASRISAEAGLMAAVAQGVTMANSAVPGMGRLREFKETLTTILLSFLFVVLAADLRLAEVTALGLPGLMVVAVVMWVARPLAVFLSTLGSDLSRRERLFVAWICPRGIVAAAVAGFFHLLLNEASIPGGASLEALVFVTVATTVAVQGLTARRLARLLRIDAPALEQTLIVGAGPFARRLGHILQEQGGRRVWFIDKNRSSLARAREKGFKATEGDALSGEDLERAEGRYADTVLALTTNGPLNALVVEAVRKHLQTPERVLPAVGRREGEAPPPNALFPGEFEGVDEVNGLVEQDSLAIDELDIEDPRWAGRPLRDLPFGSKEFAIALRSGDSMIVAAGEDELSLGDRLWIARPVQRSGQGLAERMTTPGPDRRAD
jgi:NhaP-type Na+/H+ or K+/H+ antiporter